MYGNEQAFREPQPLGRPITAFRYWYGLRWLLLMVASRLTRGTAPYASGEDTTCEITCACGHRISISETPHWCLKCGRGYMTDFVIRELPRWMRPSPGDLLRMVRREEAIIERIEREDSPIYRGMLPYHRSDLEQLRAQAQARKDGDW